MSTELTDLGRAIPRPPDGTTLAQYLPAIFRGEPDFLDLLAAFEEILLGPGKDGSLGLEQQISRLPQLLDAQALYDAGVGRRDFLPWLAQWVALGDYHGLSHAELRLLVPRIVPLYAQRGTKGYLLALLELLAPALQAEIDDSELPAFVIGEAQVGRHTRLGGDVPYWFLVRLSSRSGELHETQRVQLLKRVQSVVDLAKPAYTAYHLEWVGA